MSSQIQAAGSISAAPARPEGVGELSAVLSLAFQEVYDQVDAGAFTIAGTVAINPGNVTRMRVVVVRVLDGQSIQVRLSSSLGSNQAFPVSGMLLVHCPNVGDEFTALSVLGTGRIEYLVAGDAS